MAPPITWHFRWVSIETYLLIQSSNLESEDLKNGTQMEDLPGFLKWPPTHTHDHPSFLRTLRSIAKVIANAFAFASALLRSRAEQGLVAMRPGLAWRKR